MAYITAITDRNQSDIDARNSKAFLNTTDWERIYGNSLETNAHLNSEFGVSISFDTCAAVTTTTIPTVAEMNLMLANIERMRAWVVANVSYHPAELNIEIKDDYAAGQSETAPNYINVNRWENHLDLIHDLERYGRVAVTGVAISGAGLTRNQGFR